MTTNRSRKITKFRGGRRCGYGQNKHRGAGQRGGRGNAGTGKKAHCCETKVWSIKKKYFGSHGFVPRLNEVSSISIRDVQDKLQSWLDRGLISKEADVFVVDLKKLGYDKLLGSGAIKKKMKLTIPFVTEKAESKLTESDCEVVKA